MPSRRVWHRGGGIKLCQACLRFENDCLPFIYMLKKHPRLQPIATELHSTFSELEESAREGCSICRIWRKALVNECHSQEELSQLFTSQDPVRLEPPSIENYSNGLDIQVLSPVKTVVKLEDRTYENTRPAPCRVWRNPEEDELWRGVRETLNECKDDHQSCRTSGNAIKTITGLQTSVLDDREMGLPRASTNAGSGARAAQEIRREESFLPTRLVHIPDNFLVRVTETESEASRDLDYVALSYCWGGDQRVKLLTDQESMLKQGLPQTEFDETIRDAFKVCRWLGISYIWIDALCIRQEENSDDFRTESRFMDKIYGCAAITLVIASASSAKEGFLHPRVMETYEIHDKYTDFAGGRLRIQRKGLNEVRAKSVVAGRGWCFQEELLARRLLYYTSHGVFWSCREGTYAEHENHTNQANEGFPKPDIVINAFDPHSFVKSHDRLHIWDQLIGEYSSRGVTKARDRLQAVRGMAQSIERQTKEEYQSGMWICRLPVELLWVTLDLKAAHIETEESGEFLQDKVPSWSWGSTPPLQRVRMPSPVISYSRARMIELCTFDDTLCLVLQGRKRLLLAGHVLHGHWPVEDSIQSAASEPPYRVFEQPDPESQSTDPECKQWALNKIKLSYEISLGREQKMIVTTELDQEIFVREEWRDPCVIQLDRAITVPYKDLVCFQINYRGFLLLEHVSNDVYRRVGCCQLHNDAAFFENAELATIRLV